MAERVETDELFDAVFRHLPTKPVALAEIRVDAFATLLSAIERSGTPVAVNDPHATGHTFAGVPVIADPKMPSGFAAIVVNKEIVQIIDLRPAQKDKA